ncbi:MAG: 50S ribosomal protein L32 [Desulfobacterales bacterium]|nr:50S ribosomal protein L32 [Desulfobacterales bacterium]
MAVPKHKTSKSKRDKRRTHQKIDAPILGTCAQCGERKLPHNACPNCGTYKGRKVVPTKDELSVKKDAK